MNFTGTVTMSKADKLFQRAFAAHNAGRLLEAEEDYRKALKITPTDYETLYLLGTVCSQQGKFLEAERFLKKAISINGRQPEAWNNLGLTYRGMRKEEEALGYYRQALKLQPDYADAHCNLANALEILGELDEAETHVREAIRLAPHLANAHYTLGLILTARDRFEEAAQCFLKGLEFKPDFASAYNDLGGIYKTWGRLPEALACFDRAIALKPDAYNSHNNRGAVYEELGRFDEALDEYETAMRLEPRDIASKWNTAYLFLRQGILDRGWEAHELRLNRIHVEDRFPYPTWNGSALSDKTLLVFAEQGLGDELFFASCIPDAIDLAHHCIIECDVRLAPLFARSFPGATVKGAKRHDINWILDMPRIDVQVPVGSLPRFVRPTLESFPDRQAYLFADPQRVDYWRNRMSSLGPGMKIGICWRSGLTTGERHKQYSELTQWANIFGIPGVQFVNLQYDECKAELEEAEKKFGISIATFPELDMRNELDETCALISSLDLVISAPTAVSEMAAALGVDIYRLDVYGKPMDALGTGRSPWHPSMSLFGQVSIGDWDTPLAQVAEAVRERFAGGSRSVETVRLQSGVEIVVDIRREAFASYVLKEQRKWFDVEYGFVIGLAEENSRIVDIGAGLGAYALPLACRARGGRVWALPGTATETDLLLCSRRHNQVEKPLSVAITDSRRRFDDEMEKYGLHAIDLVRVSVEFSHVGFFDSARHFLGANSPLLMFGIAADARAQTEAALQWLRTNDYEIYRFVPGLELLVPLASMNELDSLANNLFACKSDRTARLAQQGYLARQSIQLESLPGINQMLWQEYLGKMPYASKALDAWQSPAARARDWEVYWMALNLYASAKTGSLPEQRHASLQTAAAIMEELGKAGAMTVSRLVTWCRILDDLGRRESAVGMLNQLCSVLSNSDGHTLDEPALALSDSFAALTPGDQLRQWLIAMVLKRREDLRSFTNFFNGRDALPALQEIRSLGYETEELDRRIAMILEQSGSADDVPDAPFSNHIVH